VILYHQILIIISNNTQRNWYTNQNNFYRQIRNFVLDTTAMPVTAGAGIHWQVAQATSLQNIVFNMRTDGGTTNAQQVSDIKQ
jgi:glucan 1,3-beta-glucosidase